MDFTAAGLSLVHGEAPKAAIECATPPTQHRGQSQSAALATPVTWGHSRGRDAPRPAAAARSAQTAQCSNGASKSGEARDNVLGAEIRVYTRTIRANGLASAATSRVAGDPEHRAPQLRSLDPRAAHGSQLFGGACSGRRSAGRSTPRASSALAPHDAHCNSTSQPRIGVASRRRRAAVRAGASLARSSPGHQELGACCSVIGHARGRSAICSARSSWRRTGRDTATRLFRWRRRSASRAAAHLPSRELDPSYCRPGEPCQLLLNPDPVSR